MSDRKIWFEHDMVRMTDEFRNELREAGDDYASDLLSDGIDDGFEVADPAWDIAEGMISMETDLRQGSKKFQLMKEVCGDYVAEGIRKRLKEGKDGLEDLA